MKIAVTGQGILAETTRKCCTASDRPTPPHSVVNHTDKDIEVLWVCYDTPLNDKGSADYEWVVARIQREISELPGTPVILISSQLPVLTTFRIQEQFPRHFLAYSPENVRVASAVADFAHQSRIVVGVRNRSRDTVIRALLEPFTQNIIFTNPETAEMVKHALNCYLGMSIAFINEIARVCDNVKANVNVVSEALLSERRISPAAPLKPGKPFGGGHLMRDILAMEDRARGHGLKIPIITHIRESNEG